MLRSITIIYQHYYVLMKMSQRVLLFIFFFFSFFFYLKYIYTYTEIKKAKVTSENGTIKLVLPLNIGPCIFPIFPDETVKDLINTIRLEDPSIKTIVFKYNEDFSRIAHTTTLEDLIQSDFIIEIDDVQHKVEITSCMYI